MAHVAALSRLSAVAATILLSTGCKVGPNYARPQLPTPAQFRFVESAQAQSLADTPWFQVFSDAALQSLLREGLTNNLDVRIAASRVEEARARAGIAKSFLYPQVDGILNNDTRYASSPIENNTTNSTTYGFRLSWELDLFGRIRRERESAVAVLLATEQGRRGVLVTLIGDVATNYFLLRELDLQLEIARQTLKLNDDTVLYFTNRLEGGVSNRLEVDRIQANRERTAATIPDLEQRIALTENLISFLVGRPPGPIDRRPLLVSDEAAPVVPSGLPASLLERRPDVVQAEQLLVAANADIGAARALFFPTISLTGFLGGVSGDLSSFLGGDGGVWSVGAGLVQPIFNGGRIRNNYEAAKARYDGALAAYQRAALNGYREVANALVTIQKLAQIRTHRQNGVTVLEDASDLARARYDSGLASYLEILTADQDLFEERLLLVQARGAELRARAELYRTLGGGWQPQPIPQQP